MTATVDQVEILFRSPAKKRHWLITRCQHQLQKQIAELGALIFARDRQRAMYADRRQACVLVMQCLVDYLDMVTLIVYRDGSEIIGLTVERVAELTGLSVRRVQRAFADLNDSGYISTTERYDQETLESTGLFKGRAAIRCINKRLFIDLGLGEKLRDVRKKKSNEIPAADRLNLARDSWANLDRIGRPAELRAAARTLGISPGALVQRIRMTGQTLREIINAHLSTYHPPD